MKYSEEKKAFRDYLASWEKLKKLNVITNKKDFTSQIGEWFVAELYRGQRAASAVQKYWDIRIRGKNIQVKTHAKADGNSSRWTPVKYEEAAPIDELIIVVFTSDYKLKEFYRIAWRDVLKLRIQNKNRIVIRWDHIKDFRIPIEKLPNQELVSLFM